jgi:predicted component of type VI protein secretion system
MSLASARAVLSVFSLLLIATACSTHGTPAAQPSPTNATLNFVAQGAASGLEREVAVCLEVAKPNLVSLHNGPRRDGAIDGRARFPAGTRAVAVVAHYAALLQQNGWVAGTDFVAADNALHFYGVTALGAGVSDTQLAVHGSTDSDNVPFRAVSPLPQ